MQVLSQIIFFTHRKWNYRASACKTMRQQFDCQYLWVRFALVLLELECAKKLG